MSETSRKLKKLVKGMLTGRTACRRCGHEVPGRNPYRILVNLGLHLEEDHPEVERLESRKERNP